MEEEDTIELIDLLRVVWKWKWFIVIFTVVCSTGAGMISFSMPKIYEISMMIEPGVFDIGPDGKFIYLDSSSNIKSKIDSQAYNTRIYKILNVDPNKLVLEFKTIQPGNSNTVKIRLEAKDVSTGIQAVSVLYHELVEEYHHYVDSRKSELDQEIAMNEHQLNNSAREKKYLEKEIDVVKTNTNRIIEERDKLMNEAGDSVDKLSLLIYSNIIQQNMAHYNGLSGQLATLMAKIETMKFEIGTLRIKRDSVENIRLIQSPQSSIYPIKPKKLLNIILAFVSGLIISTVLAFFLEYLQKTRVTTKTSAPTSQAPSAKE